MDVSLVMFTAEGDRRDFAVRKSPTVIGRQPDCDLRIPLASVSRQHCELAFEDGQLTLRDLGSSNGTYHNSSRVQTATLSAGDEVVVGPVVFTVVIDGYPSEVNPVRSVVGEGASAQGVAGEASAGGEGALPAVEMDQPGSAEDAEHPTGAHHLAEAAQEASPEGDAGGDSQFDEDAIAALAGEAGGEEETEQPTVEERVTDEEETQHGDQPGSG
jgi:pSer/pThr/pTyr-binding forkhead associated (FHA) protein